MPRAMRPKSSSPSLAMNCTFAPSRATAIAWFEPLPPGPMRKPLPMTVSVHSGRRGVRKVRSAAKMPITMIMAPSSAQRSRGPQHLGRVTGDRALAPDLGDFALRVDEEGGALGAQVFAAVHRLLGPAAIALDHVAALVRGEREAQRIFGSEFLDRLHRVLRDADDLHTVAAELRQCLLEGAGFLGAAGGIGLRVEVEHEGFASHSAQTHVATAGSRHVEIGSGVTWGEGHSETPL